MRGRRNVSCEKAEKWMTYEGRKKLSLYTSDAAAGTAGPISEEKICEVLEQKSMHKKYAVETIGVRAATESAGKCTKGQENYRKNTGKTQEKYSKITGYCPFPCWKHDVHET